MIAFLFVATEEFPFFFFILFELKKSELCERNKILSFHLRKTYHSIALDHIVRVLSGQQIKRSGMSICQILNQDPGYGTNQKTVRD